MLGSFVVLQFWGYHFRPYSLVFTCIFRRSAAGSEGRPSPATWVAGDGLRPALLLPVSCFAFWLV